MRANQICGKFCCFVCYCVTQCICVVSIRLHTSLFRGISLIQLSQHYSNCNRSSTISVLLLLPMHAVGSDHLIALCTPSETQTATSLLLCGMIFSGVSFALVRHFQLVLISFVVPCRICFDSANSSCLRRCLYILFDKESEMYQCSAMIKACHREDALAMRPHTSYQLSDIWLVKEMERRLGRYFFAHPITTQSASRELQLLAKG